MIKIVNVLIQVLQFKNDKIQQLKQVNLMIEAMLSTIKIRQIPQCAALYDNYGDKVIIHWSSPIALDLTNEIEQRKQQLTEKIT